MKRRLLFLLFLLLIPVSSDSGTTVNPDTGNLDVTIDIQEEDGSPIVYAPTTFKVPNNSLVDNGDTTCSLNPFSASTGIADTYVLWSNAGIISGEINLTYDDSTKDLTLQRAADNFHLYLNCYSADSSDYPRLYFQKSHNNTLGTMTTTLDNEWLGNIKYLGTNNVGLFAGGAQMTVQQDGAAGAYVPTEMKWTTYSAVGENANQLVLDNTGYVGIGTLTPDEALDVANGGKLTIHSAGDDKSIDIYHDDTDADITVSSGELNLSASVFDFDSNSNTQCIYIRGLDAGTEWANLFVNAADDFNITVNGGGATINATDLTIGNGDVSAGLLIINEDTDDGANYSSFTVPALAANLAYTLPATFGAAGSQLTDAAGNGTLSWAAAGGAGATAYDDIGDPDAAGSISFDDNETATYTSAEDTGSFFNIALTDNDGFAGVTTGLDISMVNNDDANGYFLRCRDDTGADDDTVFILGQGGKLTIGEGAADWILPTARGAASTILADSGAAAGAYQFRTLAAVLAEIGNIALTIGDGTTDSITISTDGTGDAEIVLPDQSISGTEILDGTIGEADLDIANAAVDEYVLSYEADTTNFQWVAAGAGGGATYREYTFLPESCVLDDNNPPAITIVESTGTGTPRFRVADFDAATDEIIYYTFVMPSDYTASSSPIIDIYWFTNDTGANEDAIWAVQLSATTPADADAMTECAMDADIATESGNCDTNEANRLLKTTITLTYATYMDSAVAGDIITFKLFRDADDSVGDADDDGLTSDARLMAIHLKIPRS